MAIQVLKVDKTVRRFSQKRDRFSRETRFEIVIFEIAPFLTDHPKYRDRLFAADSRDDLQR